MTRFAALVLTLFATFLLAVAQADANPRPERTTDFGRDWRFRLGDVEKGQDPALDDSGWRLLDVPHDWSVEGEFSEKNPASPGGGALPGGVGWYRKTFTLPPSTAARAVFVDFDGVYRNAEVWINGKYLGKRPYGYSSFRYDLTPHLDLQGGKNVVAVRVDNSKQPNSRWYSGSGIYRNVWLTVTSPVYVDHWGTYVTTPEILGQWARVQVETTVRNDSSGERAMTLTTIFYDPSGKEVTRKTSPQSIPAGSLAKFRQLVTVAGPQLWSDESPRLYKAVSVVQSGDTELDRYETPFGIRGFTFDREKGFILNGKPVKIRGVCNHHDLGALGAAVNVRALERQLEILKEMGVNAIRTSHNPPAPELLDLCDRMGFVVMDEAFDMWKKKKTDFDYSLDFDEWHKRDLEDMVLRDRNHPSVIAWSIGNEILEQWDESGIELTRRLTSIVKALDVTRPVTAGCNETKPTNSLIKSGALDLIGFNYHHQEYEDFPKTYPGQLFVSSEAASALATRGSYDMPSDMIRRWPKKWDEPFKDGNPDLSCSSYDNCSAPWGSTHEETWKVIKKHAFLSGLFVWTGFDYLGEPTPYTWPARSSYFGIVDLAGFPKDSYYMYQSEWTTKPVLHVFPHWNWKAGETVDVWAYYNNAEEVELFLNGKSLGAKRKTGDELHVWWRVPYEAGTLQAVSRAKGKEVLVREVRTAGKPARIVCTPDRATIAADGRDLSFVTVKIVDENGTVVPYADNLVTFKVTGAGFVAAVDNGSPTSHEPFKAEYRKAFHGLCLAVIQSNGKPGAVTLTATAEGLAPATVAIQVK